MKKKKLLCTALSVLLLTGCNADEILTGSKTGIHFPITEPAEISNKETVWSGVLTISELSYYDGDIIADVTNLSAHSLSVAITIRWNCNGNSGRDVAFVKLKGNETVSMHYTDYALDSPGDTYRVMRVERVNFGEWESLEDYQASVNEPTDFHEELDAYKEKLKSLLGH